uniref:Acetyl-coenzyme A carboxylase carboxyl transferase subunit beta, chloroplastic n=1 Tax=Sagittaria trifolia TaxID=63789 RepID=A0A513U1I1_9LILI|nr:acetyl-CoA carboxylase carboxyltransferase beta subunit [Sagittaria trifolia]YP_010518668.1 acetyl-CoA carboxylase carboxyltransferase beta subunit [Sagittaria graminea]QDG01483.1 acetyl-CoA carboxylase carboxyltransferase beta subunit [Sagittaria trifolia]UDZ59272.1 acetyl-coA carboxylase beta subunit [Sagittaria trifolia]UXO94282.1 acetyl-CoA carboxylase carboxyltransferase beta subunit [Sagittaria graminea]
MEKWWFHSMSSNKELESRWERNTSMYSLYSIGRTSENEVLVRNHTEKNISSWNESGGCPSSNIEHLFAIKGIGGLISDDIFFVRDDNGDSYFIYFDIENQSLEIDNGSSFLNELESFFSNSRISDCLTNSIISYCLTNSIISYCLNSISKSKDYYHSIYDTQSSWKNHINSRIASYLRFATSMDSSISGGAVNSAESSISNDESRNSSINDINDESRNSSINDINDESRNSSMTASDNESENESDNENDFNRRVNDPGLSISEKYGHLWVLCENCYELTYKKFFKSKMNICEHCGYHLKMSSSDRIELLVDPGTWDPINEDMISMDPIEFDSETDPSEFDPQLEILEFDSLTDPLDSEIDLSEFDFEEDPIEFDFEEEPYRDRIDFYEREAGLTEAVQTGIGRLNGIPIAIGVMDFEFLGGSMGSVVGEKITRLIEYASNGSLPLIIVCASGGARMQEGSLSLMQMAKISSALYDYQLNKKLFYVSILTSPTTGGVTASFGMLGDIIIAEPNAYIAFAGKRVIEQTLNTTIPEGSQESEYLFEKGLFDLIVPRNLLKGVLTELFQLHGFLPLNPNSKN